MEAWLAELEKEMDEYPMTLINHRHDDDDHHHQSEIIETSFDEQIAAAFNYEDMSYPLSSESNTSSPQIDFNYNIIEPFISNNNNNNKVVGTLLVNPNNVPERRQLEDRKGSNPLLSDVQLSMVVGDDHHQMMQQQQHDDDDHGRIKEDSKQTTGGGRGGNTNKRKREPSQVHDHIIAERKRRELLRQRFIALSAMVPGLKKMDKTSVLGEAIKYLKQIQEKVKVLEEVAAKRTIESVVVVKKSQLVIDDDGDDDNDSSDSVDDNSATIGGGGGGGNLINDSLPKIEVKVSGKSLLLRIYCEKQKGVLGKLFAELEKHNMGVVNSSIMPFGSFALDITIIAQIEKGLDKNVTDLVRTLRSYLLLDTHKNQGQKTAS